MNEIVVGLVAGAVPSLGAWIGIRANGRERRKDQKASWARDDAVAARAEEAAERLHSAQQESIRRTDEVAKRVAAATTSTDRKLDAIDAQGRIIHGLVNKKLTDVTEQALATTLTLLPYLEEAVSRTLAGGGAPPADAVQRVDETKRAIIDLRATLEQREQNQARVDARAADVDLERAEGRATKRLTEGP